MSITASPNQKLLDLQQLAQRYNQKLIAEFPTANFARGGDLFLGKHYCQSNRIFLGLNPGGDEPHAFKTDLREGGNFWDDPDSGYRYWENCKLFVNGAKGLHDWITSATVAYCCPWRTRNQTELYKLNDQTGGRLFQYCGELLRRLVKDQKERSPDSRVLLVVAGRASLHLLSSEPLLHINWRDHLKFDNGARGTYRWAKVEWENIVLYQVPHFSRANCHHQLKQCAGWVAQDLGL